MIGGARVEQSSEQGVFSLRWNAEASPRFAERMGYTQPGITRMINYSLEKENSGFKPASCGGKRGVVATANGREMIPGPREMVRVQRVAEEQGSNISGMLSGFAHHRRYWSVGQQWMPSILARSAIANPGVNRIVARGWLVASSGACSRNVSVDLCFCGGALARAWSAIGCAMRKDELLAWLPAGASQGGALRPFPLPMWRASRSSSPCPGRIRTSTASSRPTM